MSGLVAIGTMIVQDIMILVCRVISQDHVTKGWSNMSRSPSRQATSLLSLVAIGTVVVKI